MWMVLHVGEAVYTEYEQLRRVKVDIVDANGRQMERRRIVDALSAEGVVKGVQTDRYLPITQDFLSQVCRDHAWEIHARYVAPLGRHPDMTGEHEEVEEGGMLTAIRFPLKVARAERIFA